MVSNPKIEYKSEFSNPSLVQELAQSIVIEENPEKSWELERFENGGLGHVTIIFDSVWHRLLFGTTETNYTAPSLSSLRTQPYAKYLYTVD